MIYYYKDNAVIKRQLHRNQLTDTTLEVLVPEGFPKLRLEIKRTMKPAEATRYPMPEKVLAVSDIEGNFYALTNILVSNGVIDSNYRWQYGKNHVVFLGDMLDRGLAVTECLWLIYSLEVQAEAAGGKVHYILGNHESMNMSRDLYYVRKKYIQLAEQFGVDYSGGHFGVHGEMGKWLRSKNMVEQIGDVLFVHGGISSDLMKSKVGLAQINEIGRRYLGAGEDQIEADGRAELIFGGKGPLWYRGLAKEKLEIDELNEILRSFDVSRIVIGHSVMKQIRPFYGGKLIGIDLIQPESEDRKTPTRALLIENGHFYEVASPGGKRLMVN
ncbi:MAG TPA: metallophosphoesterase [Sphingobacteriaceae bacterium]